MMVEVAALTTAFSARAPANPQPITRLPIQDASTPAPDAGDLASQLAAGDERERVLDLIPTADAQRIDEAQAHRLDGNQQITRARRWLRRIRPRSVVLGSP